MSRGKPRSSHGRCEQGEKVNVVLPLTDGFCSLPDRYVFMATGAGHGQERRRLDEFSNPQAGIIAVDLDPGDYLIGARLTDGHHDVMLFSDGGKAVRLRRGRRAP